QGRTPGGPEALLVTQDGGDTWERQSLANLPRDERSLMDVALASTTGAFPALYLVTRKTLESRPRPGSSLTRPLPYYDFQVYRSHDLGREWSPIITFSGWEDQAPR